VGDGKIGHVSLVVMAADGFLGHIADKSFNALEDVLQGIGRIHRQAHTGSQEEQQQHQENQNFHGETVADGPGGMLDRNVQRLQQSQHWAAKQVVQELGKSKLFHFVR
jgi:hypothetical protein